MLSDFEIDVAEDEVCLQANRFAEFLCSCSVVKHVPSDYSHLPHLSLSELVALLLVCSSKLVPAVRDEIKTRYLTEENAEVFRLASQIHSSTDRAADMWDLQA